MFLAQGTGFHMAEVPYAATINFSFGSFSFGRSASGASECGPEFDSYVRRNLDENFPFNPTGPSSRTVTDLWKNRRFRLYKSETETRQGKVASWEQFNIDPFSLQTSWKITLEMDMMTGENKKYDSGDAVIIQNLPKVHHGKSAIVVKPLKDGRYKVKLEDEDLKFVTVKAENLQEKCTFIVKRMNVNGGGTLDDGERLLSLEWIDPPAPTLRVSNESCVTCPTCRAVEPTFVSFDDTVERIAATECPICTDCKPCRTLQCSHVICMDCWQQWRVSATNEIPSSLSTPITDADVLQRERDRNFQKIRALLPHVMGGTATKPAGRRQVTPEQVEYAMNRFFDRVEDIVHELDQKVSEETEEGYASFWRKLQTVSVHLPCLVGGLEQFFGELRSIAPVQILMRVLEQRAQEISSFTSCSMENENLGGIEIRGGQGRVEYLLALCCNRIGELQEAFQNYASAIHWYERAIIYAKRRYDIDGGSGDTIQAPCKESLSIQYTNLGLAQKRFGQLSKAMACYETALEFKVSENTMQNKDILESELESWTGTSGRLTPGC